MMGRSPCCTKVGLNRGPWTSEEDAILAKYIETHGEGRWRNVPKAAGLLRCGKSCRLRWVNYLRPAVKRGNISEDEENLIIKLHFLLGNRWSLIAGRMPGRTDNEIKNYWNTHMTKKLKKLGINPNTHKPLCTPQNNQITVVRTTSVFQSQDSIISKCLKPTSQKTISTHEVPFDPGDKLVYHTLTTSDGAMSAEIASSSTKIIKTSEMVNCPISRTTHVGSESMEQASSFSMNSEHQRKSVQAISTFISVEDDSFSLSWSSPSSVLCTHDFSSSSKCDSPSSLFTNSKCSEDRFTRPPHNFAPEQMEISNEQPHDFSSTLQLITDQTNVNSPTSVEFFHDSTANKIMMTNTGSFVHVPETLKLGMNSGQAADQLSMLDIPEADGEFWNYIKKQEVANYSESESPFSIFTTDWWDGFVQVVRSSDADQSPNCNTSNYNDSFTLNFPDMCELELESCRRPVIFPQHLDHLSIVETCNWNPILKFESRIQGDRYEVTED